MAPAPSNVFLELTGEFNRGRLRAVLCGGQAAVVHRLAFMSKDGDWIMREEPETLEHLLAAILEWHGAHYRFGAPLDVRWLSGGWSAHLEFRREGLRVRTDFFTRPPRITGTALERLWRDLEGHDPPCVDVVTLAQMKMTNREKDYAVIGELARRMPVARDQLRFSRSARVFVELAARHPALAHELAAERPLLATVSQGLEAVERALDEERRRLMHANEARLQGFARAAERWAEAWPAVEAEIGSLPLRDAHRVLVSRASGVLPFSVPDHA